MSEPPAVIRPGFGIVAIVVVAAAIGAVAVWSGRSGREQVGQGSDRFAYDLETYKKIDSSLIKYRETGDFSAALDRPRAIAVGPADLVYVAGNRAIVVFDPSGTKRGQVDLEDSPWCLAVVGGKDPADGTIYVGMKNHVEVYDLQGSRRASGENLGPRALLTSLAAAEGDLFVADAGNRVVWHCDTGGKVVGSIGKRDDDRHIPGFVIPSPYFDVAVSPDGLVRVANPGKHRVEGYTVDGDLEAAWGKASLAIDGFCGCCNPAHLAILPDGRFVTVEKGLPRVKVYDPEGQLVAVVAGPEQLTPTTTMTEETRSAYRLAVFDVAADSRGRILLLDPSSDRVRVFEPRETDATTTEKRDE